MAAVVRSKVFDDAGFPKTPSTAQGRIDAALIAACEVLEPVFVKALCGPDNEAEQKVMLKLFGRRVRGSLDSAPIYCTRSQVGQYNSHYGGLIRKMIVFARHDGQIELITKTFDGNKYDNHLLDECSDKGEIERMLEARTYFGDLHFRRPGVINHAGRLSLAAAEEGKARENLATHSERNLATHSERQGFIRARVEHCFCASRMRRFKRISPWRGTTIQYLDLAVRCIAAVLNFEIQETYKNQCFYTKPLTYSRICEKTHGFKVTKTGEKLPDPMCFQSGVGEGAAVAAQAGGEAAAADDDDDSASRESATTSGDDESSVSELDYESEGSNFTAHSHHGKAAKKKHRTEGDAPRNK